MATTTISYWVLIFKTGTGKITLRSQIAAFTTTQISHSSATLRKKAVSKESDALQILSDIRAHDLLTAVIPEESHRGAHDFLGYAMSPDHPPDLAVLIDCYSVEKDGHWVTDGLVRPLWESTIDRTDIAQLILHGVQLLSFVASEDSSYTLSFKVTGGDKLTLGPGSNQLPF